MGGRQGTAATPAPHAIFRFPRIGIVAAVLAMMFGSPFALSYPPFATVYLVPLAVIYWIVRVRTVADADGLTIRTLFSSEHLLWTQLRGLSITTKSKVRAVRKDGAEVPLPAVTPRHLPIISAVSNGRLPDPTAGSGGQDRSSAAGDSDGSNTGAGSSHTDDHDVDGTDNGDDGVGGEQLRQTIADPTPDTHTSTVNNGSDVEDAAGTAPDAGGQRDDEPDGQSADELRGSSSS